MSTRTEKDALHLVQAVSDDVLEGFDSIRECTGKDLVIFLGPTQVGKSTTINALLGAKFKTSGYRLEMDEEPEGIRLARMGSFEDGGLSETQHPNLYVKEGYRFAFLDTRGFFDTSQDEAASVGSSMLLNMAISLARSVRIVVVMDYRDLEKGLNSLQFMGDVLSKIVKTNDVDIYFLFNRYVPTNAVFEAHPFFKPKQESETFRDVFSDEEEAQQNKYIMDSIQKCFARLREGFMKEKGKFLQRLAQNAAFRQDVMPAMNEAEKQGSEESAMKAMDTLMDVIEKDSTSLESMESFSADTRYIDLLSHSLSQPDTHFGYINPLQHQSVARLLHHIENIPKVDPEKLALDSHNTDMLTFNRAFESVLNQEIVLLKQVQFAIKFGSSLPALLPSLQSKLDHAKELYRKFNMGEEIEYSPDLTAMEERLKECDEKMKQLQSQIRELETRPLKPRLLVSEQRNRKILEWIRIPVRYPGETAVESIPYEHMEIHSSGFEPYKKHEIVGKTIYNVDWATGGKVKKALYHTRNGFLKVLSPIIKLADMLKGSGSTVNTGNIASASTSTAEAITSEDLDVVYLKIILYFKATEEEAPLYHRLLRERDALDREIKQLVERRYNLTLSVDNRLRKDIALLEQDMATLKEAEMMCASVMTIWKGADPSRIYPTFAERMEERSKFVQAVFPTEGGKNPSERTFLEEYHKTQSTVQQAVAEENATPVLIEFRTIAASAEPNTNIAFVAQPPEVNPLP